MQLELFEEIVTEENADVKRFELLAKANAAINKFGKNTGTYYIKKYTMYGKNKITDENVTIESYYFTNRLFCSVEVDWTDFFKVTLDEAKQLVEAKLASQWDNYW